MSGFIQQLIKDCDRTGQRMGQRFVNLYIRNPWPELYYEENEFMSVKIIAEWLVDHQYYDNEPPLAEDNKNETPENR